MRYVPLPGREAESHVSPVFVFGISGATWQVIDPLLAQGRMPTLSGLMERGWAATLESVRAPGDDHYRPQTAWPTLATGVGPERHGATRFFHTATDLREEPLWERYRAAGLRVGLYGWPLTWPPSELDGFIIPCHLARDARTWPPSLSWIPALEHGQRLSERAESRRLPLQILAAVRLARFGVRRRTLARLGLTAMTSAFADTEKRALSVRRAKLELNAEVFAGLYRCATPDFAAFVTFFVDFVSHRYWHYSQRRESSFPALSGERFADALASSYEECDRVLGRLLDLLPQSAVIAVVSEHGMTPESEPLEVGEWRYIIRARRLKELAGLAPDLAVRPVARWVAYRMPDGRPIPSGTVERLRDVHVVETGLPLFEVFQHGADEVVVKFALDRRVPRYQLGDLDSLHVASGTRREIPFSDVARRFGRRRSAMHGPDGILVLAGPGVRHQPQREKARLVDFAPTILAAAGLGVPDGLEGHPLAVFGESAASSD